MVCFRRRGVGFPDDFVEFHDVSQPNVQPMVRARHYFAAEPAVPTPDGYHRAGEHAEWNFL